MENTNFFEARDLFSLIDQYLKHKQYKTALDPFVDYIDFIFSLTHAGTVQKGTGIILRQQQYETSKLITKTSGQNVALHLGDSLEILPTLKEKYDVIVSFPPMNMRVDRQRLVKYGVESIHDDYSNIIIFKALEKLSDTGECLIVVPNSFFLKPAGVKTLLSQKGYFINSVIKLYPSLLRPLTAVVPNIVVISKIDTSGTFIAKYSPEYDKDQFVANWLKRKPSANPELGTLIDYKDLTTVDTVLGQLKMERELKNYPYPSQPLTDLIVEATLGSHAKDIESFEEKPNAVFIPLLGTSPVVTKTSDLKIKPQNYIQLVMDETKIISEYLAGFFNSKVGTQVLNSAKSGIFIEKLSKRNLELISVPVPPLTTQLDLVKVNNQIKQLSAIANNLDTQLWDKPGSIAHIHKELSLINKGDDIEYLIKNLPFPVASILMKYHREDNPDKKLSYLNYFFEALAELLGTIFISSFYGEKTGVDLLREILATDRDREALKRTTFGGWVNIATRFARKYRELLSSTNEGDRDYAKGLLKIENSAVITALLNKDMYVVLEEVSRKRNDWFGHSAPVDDSETLKRCEILKYNLDKIYNQLLETFDRYLLIKPRSEMTYEDGIFNVKVDIIAGSDTNFERTSVRIVNAPAKDYLHFFEESNSQTLVLLPFVKLRPAPRTELNSCYFYNRTEKSGGYRWLSYHFESESEIVEKDNELEKVLEVIT